MSCVVFGKAGMIDFLQRQLEEAYRIESTHRAASFLVDSDTAQLLGHTVRAKEELLLAEGKDGVEMALYVEPRLLESVSALGFHRAVEHDLDGLCQVAEGVSHFLYFTRAAEAHRAVSLLELEAQAEVDKFVLCLLPKWGGDVVQWAKTLMERLFANIKFVSHLSMSERWRYFEANRLARNYCQRLMRLVQRFDLAAVLREVRHSYRMGAEAKLLYLGHGVG